MAYLAMGCRLRTLHQLNSDLLIVLIGLHLAGLIVHRLLGEPLVAAMLVGTKRFRQPPVDARMVELHDTAFTRDWCLVDCGWCCPMALVLLSYCLSCRLRKRA